MTKLNLFAVVLVSIAVFAGQVQADIAVGARSWLAIGNLETDDSVGYGATFEYIGWGDLNLELAADYISYDYPIGGVSTDVDLLPISLTAKWYPWEKDLFATYMGGGFAYYLVDADGGVDVDDEFGYHVVMGSDIYLTKTLALVLEGKYHWADSEDIDLDGWSAYAGLKLFLQ